jgi:hypothetical protein
MQACVRYGTGNFSQRFCVYVHQLFLLCCARPHSPVPAGGPVLEGAFFVSPEAHPAGMQPGTEGRGEHESSAHTQTQTQAAVQGIASWQPLFSGPHGQTALHAACEAGALDMVHLLLKYVSMLLIVLGE